MNIIKQDECDKYYDLEVFDTYLDISMNPEKIKQAKIKKMKHLKLMNINGYGIGQATFIEDTGHMIILPWCYILSMLPSKYKQ